MVVMVILSHAETVHSLIYFLWDFDLLLRRFCSVWTCRALKRASGPNPSASSSSSTEYFACDFFRRFRCRCSSRGSPFLSFEKLAFMLDFFFLLYFPRLFSRAPSIVCTYISLGESFRFLLFRCPFWCRRSFHLSNLAFPCVWGW